MTKTKTYNGTPCAAAGHTLRYVASGACVLCARAATTIWRKANPERVAAQKARVDKVAARRRAADWRKANPEKAHAQNAKLYGRCPSADAKARAEHDGTCAICKTRSSRGQGWHVDHVHDGSGSVRGILCYACNVGLGHFKDDPGLLRKALAYLTAPVRYPARTE